MDRLPSTKGLTTLRSRHPHRQHELQTEITSAYLDNGLDGSFSEAASCQDTLPLPKARLSKQQAAPPTNRKARYDELEASDTPSYCTSDAWGTSWTSLQGLASNLLGIRGSRDTKANGPSSSRANPPLAYPVRKKGPRPAQWGPRGTLEIPVGGGTEQDREGQAQARKRETLLTAHGHVLADTRAQYKRRNSDVEAPISHEVAEAELRVYVHKVQSTDTLEGVAIKYKCQPPVFRRYNRLWPNDSIQIRQVVYLPVNACGVRGRRLPGLHDTLHASSTYDTVKNDDSKIFTGSQGPKPLSSSGASTGVLAAPSEDDEPQRFHDSWVHIDGFPNAVEIARLNPKVKGYFPRSRRKSISSDLGSSQASSDLPRSNYQGAIENSHLQQRSRPRQSSSHHVLINLHGPGGVGTMKGNVRSPGPAQDGLNKIFASHLPDMAPKPSHHTLDFLDSVTPHTYGSIENASGTVESWVRRMATRASVSVGSPTLSNKPYSGDLIELSEDAFVLAEDVCQDHEGIEDFERRTNMSDLNAGPRIRLPRERLL